MHEKKSVALNWQSLHWPDIYLVSGQPYPVSIQIMKWYLIHVLRMKTEETQLYS